MPVSFGSLFCWLSRWNLAGHLRDRYLARAFRQVGEKPPTGAIIEKSGLRLQSQSSFLRISGSFSEGTNGTPERTVIQRFCIPMVSIEMRR